MVIDTEHALLNRRGAVDTAGAGQEGEWPGTRLLRCTVKLMNEDTPWTAGPWKCSDENPCTIQIDMEGMDNPLAYRELLGEAFMTAHDRATADPHADMMIAENKPEAMANARLMAAAPELYEALVAVCEHSDPLATWGVELREQVAAALLKARGE